MIDIKTIARLLNFDIELKYYYHYNKPPRWISSIRYWEVMVPPAGLGSICGRGNTPIEALNNLCKNLAGQTIVKHASSKEKRFEYIVPIDLIYINNEV